MEASDATFEATSYKCPGLQSYDEGEDASHGELSEDCLYLNVWTTDLNMRKDRPVMVWIHGGSYGYTYVGSFNNPPLREDDGIIPFDGYKAVLEGASKDVDLMIGTVADEIRYWAHLQYDETDPNGPLDHYYVWAVSSHARIISDICIQQS